MLGDVQFVMHGVSPQKTEKLQHVKQVHGRTTTGASNKSTAVFTCNHEGCDRKFSWYHLVSA